MRLFLRMSVGFLLLCVVLFAFAFFFGPRSFRQALHDGTSTVGQLDVNHTLTPSDTKSPENQPNPKRVGDTSSSQSGSTEAPSR